MLIKIKVIHGITGAKAAPVPQPEHMNKAESASTIINAREAMVRGAEVGESFASRGHGLLTEVQAKWNSSITGDGSEAKP